MSSPRRWPGGSRRRRGNALIEFTFVTLILYLLLAGIFDFGRALYSAQVTEQTADFIAREISRLPLPATATFTGLYDPSDSSYADWAPIRQNVYTEDYLVIDISTWMSGGTGKTLMEFVDGIANPPVPPGNKLLIPLMVVQSSTQDSAVPSGRTFLMYPGALQPSRTAPSGYTILIPQVSYAADGTEQIAPPSQWLHAVEPMLQNNQDVFSLTPPGQGLVALRVNYAFQAAALTQAGANPAAFTQLGGGQKPAKVSDPSGKFGSYTGPEGLGEQAAYAQVVRPYRRIISSQAVYRREIFN